MFRFIFTFLIFGSFVSTGSLGCPDLLPYRSSSVQKFFDPSNLVGFWYEQAYADLAQIGASCPTLNFTLNSSTGRLDCDFKVKYSIVPFTIKELYFPVNATELGHYTKQADMPGGKLLKLDTVWVDFTVDSNGLYDTCIIYSCVVKVIEVIIATREKYPTNDVLQKVIKSAESLIPNFNGTSLNVVDWSKC